MSPLRRPDSEDSGSSQTVNGGSTGELLDAPASQDTSGDELQEQEPAHLCPIIIFVTKIFRHLTFISMTHIMTCCLVFVWRHGRGQSTQIKHLEIIIAFLCEPYPVFKY